ncbi:unnamed protein product [Didymodactylos carnosus]|uniref:Serine/threonine-protein phosphatase n=1 Tax=Didymodactylos carnosus TaxID=1234261 RepID=A0A8S2DA79_9BILA|nr:unnamed protein product [Didymodactylos carnosus]CAF3627710.1 unnamed protein product [Didymodactylos carnosus]
MKLVICVIIDKERDAILLCEQQYNRGYWFPYDELKPGETRVLAAKRISLKACSSDCDLVTLLKIRCCDQLPCFQSFQTFYLLNRGKAARNNSISTNHVWMTLERLKTAVKNRELLGMEPLFQLKSILEKQQSHEDPILGSQVIEEPVLQFIECKQPDQNNQTNASPQEQLIGSAKFNAKIQEKVFKEFYSHTFPSEYMSYQTFGEAMDNKILAPDKHKLQHYFRAFDSQQKSYLTYSEYLLGLAALDPNTSHGGAPAEQRCRYIFRFYNTTNSGSISIDEFRELHADVQNLKGGKTNINGDPPPYNEVLAAFNSFSIQTDHKLQLTDFLNSVGQLKYRGTSVLFRLNSSVQELLRVSKRYKESKSESSFDKSVPNQPYEIADHCVTLKKSGTLAQVESLRTMINRNADQLSYTTENAFKNLPRSSSEEIFDRRTVATDIQDSLRYFEKRDQTKEALTWTPSSFASLAKCIINLCKEVREVIKREPRCLKVSSPCYILGDIHGNYQDLVCFEKSLWRATPLLSPASFVFLGDFVDRGIHGLEVIIYLLAAKFQCPKKVVLLRGNHEIRKVQQMFSFYRECMTKFGDSLGKEVWEAINTVFDVLPLSAVIDDKILCLHGGIPSPLNCPGDFITTVNEIPNPLSDPENESPLAWELMWNDPYSIDSTNQAPVGATGGFFNNTRRSTGNFFTTEALVAFLEKNSFTHVVRAHEVQQVGFKVQLNGRLLTVFSSSHYCGGTNEAATVLCDSGKLRLIKLDTT